MHIRWFPVFAFVVVLAIIGVLVLTCLIIAILVNITQSDKNVLTQLKELRHVQEYKVTIELFNESFGVLYQFNRNTTQGQTDNLTKILGI